MSLNGAQGSLGCMRSVVLAAACAGIFLLGTGRAAASCILRSANYRAQDVVMDMGAVVIPPNLAVGGVIKEISSVIYGQESIARCRFYGGSAIGKFVNSAQQVPVSGFDDVYATDVAGVGIRLFRDSGEIQTYYPHNLQLRGFSILNLAGGRFRIQLIKTAAQTGAGPIAPSGRFTVYYFDGDGPSRPVLTSTFRGSGTTVVVPTCSVQAGSRNIVVDFGKLPNTAFNGVGSRAGERDFQIGLDCEGSNLSSYQTSVGIRLDATQDSSNRPGVLQINNGTNAARGIGIELVDMSSGSEAELRFGERIEIGKTTTGKSTLTLPLRARYIQTAAGQVGAGDASGSATFTIEYN